MEREGSKRSQGIECRSKTDISHGSFRVVCIVLDSMLVMPFSRLRATISYVLLSIVYHFGLHFSGPHLESGFRHKHAVAVEVEPHHMLACVDHRSKIA